MKDPLWDTAILVERAVNEAMELLEESDNDRLRALCGRLVQLDRLVLKAADANLKDRDFITCCGECPGVFTPEDEDDAQCHFSKKALERTALWYHAPPEWCPLRNGTYVLETVLQPYGETK